MPLQVRTGAVLAGFRLKSLLGESAMGTVYLAEETTTGRRVAVKLLAPELARGERFRRRFLRETELASNLDHPHVVPTLASGEEDGTLYLAMAYVDGPKSSARSGSSRPSRRRSARRSAAPLSCRGAARRHSARLQQLAGRRLVDERAALESQKRAPERFLAPQLVQTFTMRV